MATTRLRPLALHHNTKFLYNILIRKNYRQPDPKKYIL